VCSTAADEGLDDLSDGELLEHVQGLVAEQNRVAARLARAVRAEECRQSAEHDGLKTMKAWLRTHTRLSGAAISCIVRQGRVVDRLPAVAAAFAAGQVTGDQVEVIAEIVTPGNLDRAIAQDIDLEVVEEALLTVAVCEPYRRLQVAVGGYLGRLNPDGTEPDPTEDRSFVLAQHPDGTVTGGLVLDQHGGETVLTAVEAYAARSRCAGDTRNRAQRQADALVQICANALATGAAPQLRSNPAQLLVMINQDDLVAPGNDPAAATSGTGALLSSTKARRVACDSQVRRIVFGPGSVPTDLGRTAPAQGPAACGARGGGRRGVFLRVRRLRGTQLVVRGPSRPGMDRRRPDRPGQPRPALRTPSHQGPPRLRRHPRSRRPLAHLATRRHGNPGTRTASSRTAPGGRVDRPADES
jgi:hypothetical protein